MTKKVQLGLRKLLFFFYQLLFLFFRKHMKFQEHEMNYCGLLVIHSRTLSLQVCPFDIVCELKVQRPDASRGTQFACDSVVNKLGKPLLNRRRKVPEQERERENRKAKKRKDDCNFIALNQGQTCESKTVAHNNFAKAMCVHSESRFIQCNILPRSCGNDKKMLISGILMT